MQMTRETAILGKLCAVCDLPDRGAWSPCTRIGVDVRLMKTAIHQRPLVTTHSTASVVIRDRQQCFTSLATSMHILKAETSSVSILNKILTDVLVDKYDFSSTVGTYFLEAHISWE